MRPVTPFREHSPDAPRPHQARAPWLERVPGSVLYTAGRTMVLCTAIFEEGVPAFLVGRDQGWSTAEYDLLPASTMPRHPRDRGGKISGRTQEIQRLIGRTIRAALDLKAFPGLTLKLDCDVLQADGGTRSSAVNGAWIAVALAGADALRSGLISRPILRRQVAALSVGILGGEHFLDLNYEEDSRADVDLTVVMDTTGGLIEVQGTAEGEPFREEDLTRMLALVRGGLRPIFDLQRSLAAGGR